MNNEDIMVYNHGEGEDKNWIVAESFFKRKYQGKCEVVMCLGNGYMGIRSATEESYIGQVRNMFVSGTFNKPSDYDVTELPNAPDMMGMDIYLDDVLFSLDKGNFTDYHRSINLRTGELIRSFVWHYESKSYAFNFRRFVSMEDIHLICTEVNIKALNTDAHVVIKSGINGQVTNSGAQHFNEGEKRIFNSTYLQMLQTTTESGITFVQNAHHDFSNGDVDVESRFEMDRRKVNMLYSAQLGKNQSLQFTKYSNVYTTRDKDVQNLDLEQIRTHSIDKLKDASSETFDTLLAKSAEKWESLWTQMDIHVESENDFDQLAIRFAQYHLLIMAPKHDARYGIGAKGLSGEGYKGHSFWDTEIFLLPFFTYTLPSVARNLLEYRYHTLGGARKKAQENGYRGAMYPWESAWADDGEVTPVWGAADIITGKATKIWSGFIEQHITSDIAFAVWQYYKITGDEAFMDSYGYEILLDTGIFWSTRLEWNDDKQAYHINNVIGPDEYKEHVNNDAFTNYMAHWCMGNASEFYDHLKKNKTELFEQLNTRLNLDEEIALLRERYEKVYLPEPNEDLVIPQDDKYLTLKEIDLTKYKNQEYVGSIFKDYNLDQINQIQVSKQASVVMLMYLLEYRFGQKIKKANYEYYEPRTLHDSSLSLSTHAVLAADIGNIPLAYSLFRRATEIDLGPKMKTSDHGIHAASLGGIWQILICGFAGVRMLDGNLRIEPSLPTAIKSIDFPLVWKGQDLRVRIADGHFTVKNNGNASVSIMHQEDEHRIEAGTELRV